MLKYDGGLVLFVVQSAMTIWQEFDRLLPLARAGAEKPLLPLRAAYTAALQKVIGSCATSFAKVNCFLFCFSRSTNQLANYQLTSTTNNT